MKMRNPAQGVRGLRLRSTCPAWGVSSLATGRTGADFLRRPWANLTAANSSTMKGLQGLAGESCERRCRIAKDLGRWVRGCFYVRSPEIVMNCVHDANCVGFGKPTYGQRPSRFARDSDVNRKVEVMTNAGSSVVAGWLSVPGHESSRCFKSHRVGVWPE